MKNWLRTGCIFLIALFSLSCDNENNNDQDYTGRWIYVEPPHPASRFNRLDKSIPVFDVVFTINNNDFTEIDLLLNGNTVNAETASRTGNNLIFQGDGFIMTLNNVRRVSNTLQVQSTQYAFPGQETKTIGPTQIDKY